MVQHWGLLSQDSCSAGMAGVLPVLTANPFDGYVGRREA